MANVNPATGQPYPNGVDPLAPAPATPNGTGTVPVGGGTGITPTQTAPTPQYDANGNLIPATGSVAAPSGNGTPATAGSAAAPFGLSPSGVPYGSQGSNNANPNSAVYSQASGAAGAAAIASGANYTPPESEEDIAAGMLKDAQSQIDAINQQFAATIAEDTQTAANNQTNVNASASRMGLVGSPNGASMLTNQANSDDKVLAADRAAQAAAIAGIYSQVDSNALAQANLEKSQATADAATYAANQQKIAATALSTAANFAAAGKTGQDVAANDPQTWDQLQQQTGLSPYALTAYMFSQLPSTYQPTATNSYSSDANGNAVENTVYTVVDPSTGKATVTQSSTPLGIPFAQFDSKNLITASDGTPLYINSAGQTIDAETGKPYIPTTSVASGSSLVNAQSGTVIVKGNDKYSVVRVGSDLNGNPVDEVFDATKGTFLGTQNADGTLAPATQSQVNTTAVPGMTLPAVTESDQLALQYTRSMTAPDGAATGYIDASDSKLSQQDLNAMEQYGKANGLTVITNATQIASLEKIAGAASDLNNESSAITDSNGNALLPANWWSADLGAGAANQLSAYLGSGTNQAAFGDYQLSMLDYIGAITGGTSGGNSRLMSILNSGTASQYLPQLTDSVTVAQAKMTIIADDIQSTLNGLLPENSSGTSSAGPSGSANYNGITLPN